MIHIEHEKHNMLPSALHNDIYIYIYIYIYYKFNVITLIQIIMEFTLFYKS